MEFIQVFGKWVSTLFCNDRIWTTCQLHTVRVRMKQTWGGVWVISTRYILGRSVTHSKQHLPVCSFCAEVWGWRVVTCLEWRSMLRDLVPFYASFSAVSCLKLKLIMCLVWLQAVFSWPAYNLATFFFFFFFFLVCECVCCVHEREMVFEREQQQTTTTTTKRRLLQMMM